MTFDEYQNESRKTARYPHVGKNFIFPALGLCGESGELADIIKKLNSNSKDNLSEEQITLIKKELGDVLWYITQIAEEFDISMEDIAKINIEKINSDEINGRSYSG